MVTQEPIRTPGSRDIGHIAISHGRVDVRTDGQSHDDVIAKTKISRMDGSPHFLNHGAPRQRRRAELYINPISFDYYRRPQ